MRRNDASKVSPETRAKQRAAKLGKTPDFDISTGYTRRWVNGRHVQEAVLVVEKILGHQLPRKAIVHHVNEDRVDNKPSNLVVCPGVAYHLLIHARMRALVACENAEWRRCGFCQQYDDIANLVKNGPRGYLHRLCKNKRQRINHKKRMEARHATALLG